MRGTRVGGHARQGHTCICGERYIDAKNRDQARAAHKLHLAAVRERREREGIAWCNAHSGEVPLAEMSGDGRWHTCKACTRAKTAAYAKANPDEWEERRRAHHLRKRYGITPEQYDEMVERQDGKCAICDRPLYGDSRGYRPHIDHCHETGEVRGVLCSDCNRGLGSFGDDPDRLRLAAYYIERNR